MIKSSILNGKGHYISGQWIQGHGTTLESLNPAYGTLFWQGTNATQQEISSAYHAAHQALFPWSALDFETRANYIQKFAKQIEKIVINWRGSSH